MADRTDRIGKLAGCFALAIAVCWGTTLGAQPQPPPQADPPSPGPIPTVPSAPTTFPVPLPNVQPQVFVPAPASLPVPQRFQFKIDPKSPVKDLLPKPPAVKEIRGPLLSADLAAVPEVEFQAAAAKRQRIDLSNSRAGFWIAVAFDIFGVPQSGAARDTALQIAKVNRLNAENRDGFIEALRSQRADLAGLPFTMGDECRTKGERSRQFTNAVNVVRRSLQAQRAVMSAPALPQVAVTQPANSPVPVQAVQAIAFQVSGVPVQPGERPRADNFWEIYQTACAEEDRATSKTDKTLREHMTLARIAALMQILMPEAPDLRLGLVKYLAGVSHAESTRALARLAVFSQESEVRSAAIEALKVRRERDYTDVLMQALQHPWPAAPKHAADAITRLERADLVPQLVSVLDTPDPRAPIEKDIDGKKTLVAREMVKINHHRNCLMCHAPGNTEEVSGEALTAPVPLPDESLPTPFEGYNGNGSPDLLVRIDVTYLRQDFSVMQAVGDAAPWPEMQRFDFLVRERTLTAEEAASFREQLTPREPGRLPPHHRAALSALRELTGKDTAPTASAWRELLASKSSGR